jgi:plastocyanin domain-containing protein
MKRLALILPLLLAGGDALSSSPTRIDIAVTEDGFTPDHITVVKGRSYALVFDRKTDETCAKKVVVDTGAKKIEKDLPLDKAVEIDVRFTKSGELSYSCGMDMVHGTISVQ